MDDEGELVPPWRVIPLARAETQRLNALRIHRARYCLAGIPAAHARMAARSVSQARALYSLSAVISSSSYFVTGYNLPSAGWRCKNDFMSFLVGQRRV